MIIATVTALAILFGGGGGNTWPGAALSVLSKSVKDGRRKAEAKAILKEMDRVIQNHEKRILETRQELLAVELRYESTEADFRAVFRKLDRIWVDTETRLTELRFELVRYFTAEEWADFAARIQEKLDKAWAKADKKRKKREAS